MCKEFFKVVTDDETYITVNMIKKINAEVNLNHISIIHWRFANKHYAFVVNEIIEITDLAINYEDNFVEHLDHISGTSLVEADKLLLILKPRAFI